jgi:hypothetical protein
MSIEVINEEFISDIGATNFRESLQYSSGVFTEQYTQGTANSAESNGKGVNETQSADISASSRSGLGGRFDNGMIVRGFNVSFQNREGFRYGGIIANYGVTLGGIIDTANVSLRHRRTFRHRERGRQAADERARLRGFAGGGQ